MGEIRNRPEVIRRGRWVANADDFDLVVLLVPYLESVLVLQDRPEVAHGRVVVTLVDSDYPGSGKEFS